MYYNIENWVWLCCLGLELGLLRSAGPILSSLELVLCEPFPGRAAFSSRVTGLSHQSRLVFNTICCVKMGTYLDILMK